MCTILPARLSQHFPRADEQSHRSPNRATADLLVASESVALALREADELCVCDLAWILERAQNLTSHHLRALRAAGLATTGARGRWRSTR